MPYFNDSDCCVHDGGVCRDDDNCAIGLTPDTSASASNSPDATASHLSPLPS